MYQLIKSVSAAGRNESNPDNRLRPLRVGQEIADIIDPLLSHTNSSKNSHI